ncbi:hypothetical protein FRC10_011087 [Ceratobasidium sp. 414]|nr:hypothetical protein FRC10_011087 [Ceratobasidium sp. 414]
MHPYSQRAHRYPQTQYQQLYRPRAPSVSGQSAPINSAAPQPRVVVDHHPSKSAPGNRFTPYGKISRPVRSERMTGTAINQYWVAESDAGGWGYTDPAGPPAPDNNTAGGVDRSASALPVASQFAGLTLAQHSPPGVKDEGPVQPPVPPVGPIINGQRAQPSDIDTSHADSSSDTIMPDAFDLIPPNRPSMRPRKTKRSRQRVCLLCHWCRLRNLRSQPDKTTTQKAGDNNVTSNAWTVDHHDLLIRRILGSDGNFNNAEKKGGNLSFWKRNKRSPEALQQRWKDLKGIYQQVKGSNRLLVAMATANSQSAGMISRPRFWTNLVGGWTLFMSGNRTPTHNAQSRVPIFIGIGFEAEMKAGTGRCMHDLSTFDGKHLRRSGSLSPLEIDSDSDGETTSKSDTNTPKRSVKPRATKWS